MKISSVIHDVEERMKKTKEVIVREFTVVRSGQASSSFVEGIKVDCYGSAMPLKQLATISTPEPHLIVIHPWDVSILPEIEKAILKSDLGLNPTDDGKFVRISIPHLTTERREELVKIIGKMVEEGRISLRTTRREAKDFLKEAEKNGEIPEDERFRLQDEIQKITDRYNKEVDTLLEEKEKEIREG